MGSSSTPDRPRLRWNAVCLDCADAETLAAFYVGLLGWEITARDGDWIKVAARDAELSLNIQAEEWYEPPVWPEQPGGQHKQLHFEIEVDDVEAAVAHAVAFGATEAPHQPADRDQEKLRVMLDPAGHPFCLWAD